jgi:hypothetical protein
MSPAVMFTAESRSKHMDNTSMAALAANHEADKAFINTPSPVGGADEEGAETNIANTTPHAGEEREAGNMTGASAQGDAVVTTINIGGPQRRRAVRRQPKVALTATNPAETQNSLGIAWALTTTSIDNAKSQKWGVALKSAMEAQGIAEFHCGDLVEIEVGVGAKHFRLTGRASRPSTAYFWIVDLTAAGIALHQGFNLVIVAVHRAGPLNPDQVVVTA